MSKINRKSILFLALGTLILSITAVISHYWALSDQSNGFFIGLGIGLSIVALISSKS